MFLWSFTFFLLLIKVKNSSFWVYMLLNVCTFKKEIVRTELMISALNSPAEHSASVILVFFFFPPLKLSLSAGNFGGPFISSGQLSRALPPHPPTCGSSVGLLCGGMWDGPRPMEINTEGCEGRRPCWRNQLRMFERGLNVCKMSALSQEDCSCCCCSLTDLNKICTDAKWCYEVEPYLLLLGVGTK